MTYNMFSVYKVDYKGAAAPEKKVLKASENHMFSFICYYCVLENMIPT